MGSGSDESIQTRFFMASQSALAARISGFLCTASRRIASRFNAAGIASSVSEKTSADELSIATKRIREIILFFMNALGDGFLQLLAEMRHVGRALFRGKLFFYLQHVLDNVLLKGRLQNVDFIQLLINLILVRVLGQQIEEPHALPAKLHAHAVGF